MSEDATAGQNREDDDCELAESPEDRDRFTLIGLAPIGLQDEADEEVAAASDVPGARSEHVEESTVREAPILAGDAEPAETVDPVDASAEEGELAAPDADLPLAPSPSEERETLAHYDFAGEDEDQDPLDDEPTMQSARQPYAMASLVNGRSASERPRTDEEAETEWLDLSTKWLIATGPQDQPLIDDAEVTDHEHWAERLAARVFPHAHANSVAPIPPALPAREPSIPASPPQAQELAVASAEPVPVVKPHWAPRRRRRHSTLAGFSPLPEQPDAAQETESPREAIARADEANAKLNPWREEQSYTTSPRQQSRERVPSQPVAAVAAPQWAPPVPVYAAPPAASVVPPPYAASTWGAAPVASAPPAPVPPPPWAATNYATTNYPASHYAAPSYAPAGYAAPGYAAAPRATPYPQYYSSPGYTPSERHTRLTDYPAPQRAAAARSGARMRAPQRPTHEREMTREQWKDIADTLLATLGKCAVAAMALHYSGLAEPILGYFGYTPASSVAPVSASASVTEQAPRPAAPSNLSVAAVSGIPDGLSAPLEEEPPPPEPPRRRAAKRETEGSVASPRRHYTRPAHKPKRSARVEDEQPEEETETAAPLAAAEPLNDDAVGEAFLRINSRPWSQVFVDGTHVGNTPKIDLRVRAGSHRIRLVNPEHNVSKIFVMDAAAGETVSRVEELDE